MILFPFLSLPFVSPALPTYPPCLVLTLGEYHLSFRYTHPPSISCNFFFIFSRLYIMLALLDLIEKERTALYMICELS